MVRPDDLSSMIPITEETLEHDWGWHEDEFEVFDSDSPREKAEFIARDGFQLAVPDLRDRTEEEAVEYMWDSIGWEQHRSPQFVRFDDHPDWDDSRINEYVAEVLEEIYRNAAGK